MQRIDRIDTMERAALERERETLRGSRWTRWRSMLRYGLVIRVNLRRRSTRRRAGPREDRRKRRPRQRGESRPEYRLIEHGRSIPAVASGILAAVTVPRCDRRGSSGERTPTGPASARPPVSSALARELVQRVDRAAAARRARSAPRAGRPASQSAGAQPNAVARRRPLRASWKRSLWTQQLQEPGDVQQQRRIANANRIDEAVRDVVTKIRYVEHLDRDLVGVVAYLPRHAQQTRHHQAKRGAVIFLVRRAARWRSGVRRRARCAGGAARAWPSRCSPPW